LGVLPRCLNTDINIHTRIYGTSTKNTADYPSPFGFWVHWALCYSLTNLVTASCSTDT